MSMCVEVWVDDNMCEPYCTYCIAGNIRGRKLSQIHKFCGYPRKFFRKIWGRGVHCCGKSRQFVKIFSAKIIFFNNLQNFSPSKFPQTVLLDFRMRPVKRYNVWAYQPVTGSQSMAQTGPPVKHMTPEWSVSMETNASRVWFFGSLSFLGSKAKWREVQEWGRYEESSLHVCVCEGVRERVRLCAVDVAFFK